MSETRPFSCPSCRTGGSFSEIRWYAEGVDGLTPREREVAEVLVRHEACLSDGFFYYGSAAMFRHVVRLLAAEPPRADRNEAAVHTTARVLLDHLESHPDRAYTPAELGEWIVPHERAEYVLPALDWLLAHRLIAEGPPTDGTRFVHALTFSSRWWMLWA